MLVGPNTFNSKLSLSLSPQFCRVQCSSYARGEKQLDKILYCYKLEPIIDLTILQSFGISTMQYVQMQNVLIVSQLRRGYVPRIFLYVSFSSDANTMGQLQQSLTNADHILPFIGRKMCMVWNFLYNDEVFTVRRFFQFQKYVGFVMPPTQQQQQGGVTWRRFLVSQQLPL